MAKGCTPVNETFKLVLTPLQMVALPVITAEVAQAHNTFKAGNTVTVGVPENVPTPQAVLLTAVIE